MKFIRDFTDYMVYIFPFLQNEIFGNRLSELLFILLNFLFLLVVFFILYYIILNRLEKWAAKTDTKYDDLIIALIKRFFLPIAFFTSVYFSLKILIISENVEKYITYIYLFILFFNLIKAINMSIEFSLKNYWDNLEKKGISSSGKKGIIPAIKVVIWVLGTILFLQNIGVNLNAVVTGLGISGIAIALAAQTILGDLFSYFSIIFDKPFEVGDFLIIDDFMGTVENIGVKTTRIRSLSGEQIVFSNSALTNSRIRNYKRMYERRVLFTIGVVYGTPQEKLEEIPKIIKGIILNIPQARFDRSHFKGYGDYSLNFETVYYVLNNDYNLYMDIQQKINLELYRIFKEKNIEFAYPTQTLFVNKIN